MLAVTGAKGGVGRTTATLGLATALADAGARPVVVDADRDAPDLTRRTDVPDAPGVAALAEGAAVDAATHPAAGRPGVGVVPSGHGTGGDAVRAALARLGPLEGPVVVDCPPGVGPAAVRPLRAADRALVVATATVPGLRGGVTAATVARTLGTTVAGALFTGTSAAPPAATDALGCPVVGRVPEVPDPLGGERARSAYDSCASAVTCQNV